MALKRTFAKQNDTRYVPGEGVQYAGDNHEVGPHEAPTLVSSKLTDGRHAPAIDIDGIPVFAVQSRTEGSYHLYIDKAMSWRQYRRILKALTKAGVVEPGYYRASVRRKASYLRLPRPSPGSFWASLRRSLGSASSVTQSYVHNHIPASARPGSSRYSNLLF